MAVAERCRMTLRAVLRSTTARSGADSTVTGGRHRPSASTFLRIVPIRRHTVAPPLGQQGRVSISDGTRPSRADLQRRRVVRPTFIMTRRKTMPTTTVVTPSASDILFHRAASVASTGPVAIWPTSPEPRGTTRTFARRTCTGAWLTSAGSRVTPTSCTARC